MKCLTAEQSEAWLAPLTVGAADPRNPPHGVFAVKCRDLESDGLRASQTYYLARLVCDWLWEHRPEQVLVLVTEWGIWSSGNEALFYAWRRFMGCNTLLDDEPGHLFLSFEREHAVSLVQMAMHAGWGLRAVSSNEYVAFTMDHDGHAYAISNVESLAEELARLMAK